MLNKYLLIILIVAHCFTTGKKFILHEYLSFIYLNNFLFLKKVIFRRIQQSVMKYQYMGYIGCMVIIVCLLSLFINFYKIFIKKRSKLGFAGV
jgi:hypothetical protein